MNDSPKYPKFFGLSFNPKGIFALYFKRRA
jgi:hypothetical protein